MVWTRQCTASASTGKKKKAPPASPGPMPYAAKHPLLSSKASPNGKTNNIGVVNNTTSVIKFKRWNSHSPEGKFLANALANGTIDLVASAKEVFDDYPDVFHPFGIDKFRAALYRAKVDLGICVRKDNKGEFDNGVVVRENFSHLFYRQ